MPLNLKLGYKGRKVDFPILGIIGMLGVATILFEVVLTHSIGRIAGPSWVVLCFLYYVWFRKSQKLPIFKSIKHNWEKEQIQVLTSAEEYDLLEQYKIALKERDKKLPEIKK
jgi:APA family basic amino acid/polyamine antiporter